MEHGNAVVIPDIGVDPRIPQEAYRPTFVKSLAMVPISQEEPIGAMGAYWASAHTATGEQVTRLQTIANAAALAVAFVQRCEAEAALRDRAAMLDALLDYIPEGITIARGPDVTIERVSAAGLKRVQRAEEDLIGISAEQHPEAWQVFDEAGKRLLAPDELPLTRAVRRGETIENEQLSLRLPDGAMLPILCNAGPIRDSAGDVTGGIIAWRDISDRVELEQERQLLVRELNHRVKNLFAMVSAMVGLTAGSSRDVREMAEALTGRIAALAHAHELIRPAVNPASSRDETILEDLLEQLLAPHLGDGTRTCRVSGPEIFMGADATTQLALVIHELATNAAKYGALSTPAGTLDLSWRRDDGSLVLTWDEQGAPPSRLEARKPGFGSKLIDATVRRQLLGEITYAWEAGGLRVDLSLPLESLRR
jgi:PAS domain S-box-containing protein